MTDKRLELAGQCVRVLRELLEPRELARLSIGLTEADAISLQAQLTDGEELAIDLYVASPPDVLDMARSTFDWVQDYLAENGDTRAQARPACPAGHAHPAICQIHDNGLYLVCPSDLRTMRRLL
jgi:hypothetical protein